MKKADKKIDRIRNMFLRTAILIAVVVVSVWIYRIRDSTLILVAFGYPGVFILSILANATVVLPAPTLAVVFTMGGLPVFNPMIVGVIAGLGSGIGELTGYMAGYSGQAVIERMNIYIKLSPYVEKYGAATIFILAAVPNPLFDLVGIAAGTLKISLRIFLPWCILGKTVKMLIFAYAGVYSINWISNFVQLAV